MQEFKEKHEKEVLTKEQVAEPSEFIKNTSQEQSNTVLNDIVTSKINDSDLRNYPQSLELRYA